jgi:hypothetical protein
MDYVRPLSSLTSDTEVRNAPVVLKKDKPQ